VPTRREVLRLLGLAALATTVPGLAACGADGPGSAGLELVASDLKRSPGDPLGIPAVVRAMHGLAGGLYGRLAAEGGNLALSPYSVAVALAMTRNGAAGATATEIDGVLGTGAQLSLRAFNDGCDALTTAVEGLAGSFERDGDDPAVIALDSADALFGDRATTWRRPFLDTLATSYGAGMRVVDWVHATEAARRAVNGWTADRTHDRIPEILPEGSVDAMTRLVLVNALYFKAPWSTEFDAHQTADAPFHLDTGESVDVPTMHGQIRSAGYGLAPACSVLRLPYFSHGLAMSLLLPDQGRLADVEKAVAAGGLPDLLAAAGHADLQLSLPKFTFRTAVGLADVLGELGMPTAFSDAADFSGMTTEEQLKIGAVLHQTYVAVDEHGTEAAAATAVGMEATSMPQYVDVVVDRPFLFVIHDVHYGTPLFLGRVADPRAT
jgi:serpin B